jgi:hypothetical protein
MLSRRRTVAIRVRRDLDGLIRSALGSRLEARGLEMKTAPHQSSSPVPKKLVATTALGCLVVALSCAAHLDQMFLDGHLGYAGALRGVIGQNYLRFDPWEIRLAPLQNGGPSFDAAPAVRFNHPPLSGMLVGLAFRLVGGASEAAARMVPLIFSVLTVPLLAAFVRRRWGDGVALAAVVVWSLSPFVAIYGAMVSYEPLLIFFWMATLWAWSCWSHAGGGRRWPVIAAAATALGVWTDWPMVALVCGLIAVEARALGLRRPRRPAMLLGLAASLAAALLSLALFYFVIL